MASGPIELKVTSATIATALSGLTVWALRTYVFHDDLPLPVSAAVQILVPAVVAFVAGWVTRHTPRPDLKVDPVDVAAACDDPTAVDSAEHRYEDLPRHAAAGDPTTQPPSATRYDGTPPPPK